MKITILCAGKIKEKYLSDGIAEYTKRLSRYCTLNIEQVRDEKTPDSASEQEEENIKRAEGERMLDLMRRLKGGDAFFIALDLKGKELSSEAFSEYLSSLMLNGKSQLVFLIGGSLGLSEEVLKEVDFKLCFSKFTFPHQLIRLVLTEQIYRAFKIRAGEPYHK